MKRGSKVRSLMNRIGSLRNFVNILGVVAALKTESTSVRRSHRYDEKLTARLIKIQWLFLRDKGGSSDQDSSSSNALICALYSDGRISDFKNQSNFIFLLNLYI